jgi:hypothetical protein
MVCAALYDAGSNDNDRGNGMEAHVAIDIDRKTTLAVFALIAGVLSLLLLVASLQPPPASPGALLAMASSHRTAYGGFASLVLAWAVFSIPLIVTLGHLLRAHGGTLAAIAQLLSAIGVLLLGFAIFVHIGAVLSIVTASGFARAEDATYHAAIWSSLAYYLTDPGLMAWGLGQLLFGWIAWRSAVLPNWLAVLGIVGGVAGLLTLAVYQTSVLALVQLASFTVWAFATGVTLLRARRTPLAGA